MYTCQNCIKNTTLGYLYYPYFGLMLLRWLSSSVGGIWRRNGHSRSTERFTYYVCPFVGLVVWTEISLLM